MNLFHPHSANLLPADGEAVYFGPVLPASRADAYFEKLMNGVSWKNDEAVIFGRRIETKRKTAWYGDQPFAYTYSNTTRRAFPWTAELLELRELVTGLTGATYNSCLLNLYHNGSEGVGWHSDDEKTLGPAPVIASLSFGAERKFAFKHKKTGLSTSVILGHGSLLLMKGVTQANWLHCIPRSKKVNRARINLTFRTIFP